MQLSERPRKKEEPQYAMATSLPLLDPLDQPLDFETTPESNPLMGPGSAQLAQNPRHRVPKPL
jgi:hypothetical protein